LQLTIVIPAHNEADGLRETVVALEAALGGAAVPHEIIIVNDHSSDWTAGVAASLAREFATVRGVENEKPGGFGYAFRTGLEQFPGGCGLYRHGRCLR
jgi:dolichol-phosphate mannosyltransferase